MAARYYTLRCYFDDKPIFLGRNGRISVFGSERALARYLADEHDHDLSDLSTYDDIRTAATDGSLRVDVTEDNVYVLSGLVDDIADGPEAIDRDQLALAVEFVRDVGDYSEDDTVEPAARRRHRDRPRWWTTCSNRDSASGRSGPYAKAVVGVGSSLSGSWSRGCGASSAAERRRAADVDARRAVDDLASASSAVHEASRPALADQGAEFESPDRRRLLVAEVVRHTTAPRKLNRASPSGMDPCSDRAWSTRASK